MWTAIALWAVIGAGVVAFASGAAHAIRAGASPWPWITAIPLVYLGSLLVFVAGYFTLAWTRRAPRPAYAKLSWRRALRLFRREYLAIAGSAPRMMGYRAVTRDPPPAPAADPILLLHGVLCNGGVWRSLKQRLRKAGLGPVYAPSYGPPLASIELFADQIAAKIDRILAATGARQVSIVAHSMGGIVARAYVRKHGGGKVRRVITIGTPHEGSAHAWLFPGTSLGQLRPGNPWLAALPEPSAASPPFVSVWSWHDSMVAPQTSARLRHGRNVEIVGVGHNALLTDPDVAQKVIDELRRGQVIDPTPKSPATSESLG
jgi:triacylglycerol esterase/lipase EstA (alpha/beta hydrolase family)